jgi:excisionase family DNA binding protein
MEQLPRPNRTRKVPAADALTISVERAGELLGISRASAYEAVKQGRIPHLRFGRKLVVPRVAVERMISEAGVARP